MIHKASKSFKLLWLGFLVLTCKILKISTYILVGVLVAVFINVQASTDILFEAIGDRARLKQAELNPMWKLFTILLMDINRFNSFSASKGNKELTSWRTFMGSWFAFTLNVTEIRKSHVSRPSGSTIRIWLYLSTLLCGTVYRFRRMEYWKLVLAWKVWFLINRSLKTKHNNFMHKIYGNNTCVHMLFRNYGLQTNIKLTKQL